MKSTPEVRESERRWNVGGRWQALAWEYRRQALRAGPGRAQGQAYRHEV